MPGLRRPVALNVSPALLMLLCGGPPATVLLLALLHVPRAFGFATPDMMLLVGGVFTGHAPTAFGIGAAVILVGALFAFPALLYGAWLLLPGNSPGMGGALLNGALWGAALWLLAGLLAPLLGVLNRVPGAESPGFFMLGAGVPAAAAVLVAHLGYGVALTLVANMGRGISPVQITGEPGYGRAHLLGPHGSWTWRGPDGWIEATRPHHHQEKES